MAKKGSSGSKKGLTNSIVWLAGGLGVAGFFAYQTNIGGFKDTISKTLTQLQQTLSTVFPGSLLIKSQTSSSQQQYPFNYPYPPTQQPQYAGPTTQSAAHYEMAGTPNIGIQGAGLLPNPNLWVPQGGITSNRVADPYAAINYGPYSATPTQFANQYYNIQGTNLQQPYIQGPIAPSPCPAGEYRAGDGRCYPLPSPPPEACPDGAYRASDGKCYAMVPGMPIGDCPGGYVKGSDGVCRQTIVCPPGYNYVDGVCKSTNPTPTPVPVPVPTPTPVPIPVPIQVAGLPITPLTVLKFKDRGTNMLYESSPATIFQNDNIRTRWTAYGTVKPQYLHTQPYIHVRTETFAQSGRTNIVIIEPASIPDFQRATAMAKGGFWNQLMNKNNIGMVLLPKFNITQTSNTGSFYTINIPNYSFFGASNPRRRRRSN